MTFFNATTGIKIAQNDDGSLVTDPVSGASWDSFLMSNLSPGSYTATLTQFGSFAAGPLFTDGFDGSGHVNFSGRDSHWALELLNVDSAMAGIPYISPVTPVPELETYAMLLAGLGLLGWKLRRA